MWVLGSKINTKDKNCLKNNPYNQQGPFLGDLMLQGVPGKLGASVEPRVSSPPKGAHSGACAP